MSQWAPPPWAPPPRRRSPALALPIALLALVVLIGGLAAVRLVDPERNDPGRGPDHALRAWFDAVGSGSVDRVRAVVAPSQRGLVDPADLAGTGRPDLRFDGISVPDRDDDATDDDALLELGYGAAACPPGTPDRPNGRDDRTQCFDVKGSGPGAQALVVREQGRWWPVAQPVRLVPRSTSFEEPVVTLTSHLVLRGGLRTDETVISQPRGHTCRNLRGSAFAFTSDITVGDTIQVRVSSFLVDLSTPVPPEQLSVSRAFDIAGWKPRGPVRLTRAADGSSGRLPLQGWRQEAILDQPVAPPVTGELTWTCKDA